MFSRHFLDLHSVFLSHAPGAETAWWNHDNRGDDSSLKDCHGITFLSFYDGIVMLVSKKAWSNQFHVWFVFKIRNCAISCWKRLLLLPTDGVAGKRQFMAARGAVAWANQNSRGILSLSLQSRRSKPIPQFPWQQVVLCPSSGGTPDDLKTCSIFLRLFALQLRIGRSTVVDCDRRGPSMRSSSAQKPALGATGACWSRRNC